MAISLPSGKLKTIQEKNRTQLGTVRDKAQRIREDHSALWQHARASISGISELMSTTVRQLGVQLGDLGFENAFAVPKVAQPVACSI